MTRQESFKRRVRARMEKTGERYVAARRVLIDRASHTGRAWVSEPEVSNDAVVEATGRGWDEWCDLIEAWPGRADGHTAIASHLEFEHDVDGWWAQTVTGGYERIAGLRLPHQMPDGTFTANKSKTITADAEIIVEMLRHPDDHTALFPGHETELRSRPGAKAIRIAIGNGVVVIGVEARPNSRAKVTIMHEKLPTSEDVERWKFYWQDWLEALDTA